MAHGTFMGKRVAAFETRSDVALFENVELCIGLVYAFLADANVEYFNMSDKLLVFGEEEG